MTDLKQETRALLDTAKRELAKDRGDRAAVRAAIDARLLAPTAAAPAVSLTATKMVALVAVVAVGASAYFLLRSAPKPAESTASTRHVSLSSATPNDVDVAQNDTQSETAQPISTWTPAVPERTNRTDRVVPNSRAPARVAAAVSAIDTPIHESTNTLEAEMLLLATANTALQEGEFARAQEILTEHAARFSSGILVEEREGLRVLIACREGSTGQQSLRENFEARFPQSAMRARIRARCATSP